MLFCLACQIDCDADMSTFAASAEIARSYSPHSGSVTLQRKWLDDTLFNGPSGETYLVFVELSCVNFIGLVPILTLDPRQSILPSFIVGQSPLLLWVGVDSNETPFFRSIHKV